MHHILSQFLARQDEIRIDLEADASDRAEELAEDKERVVRVEELRMARMTGPFHNGLRRAYQAMRAGGDAISLDDRDEEENRQADALVNFLVRTRLASSMTRETDDNHYIYTISVDWDALEDVAAQARVNLASILGAGD
ncbi:MAG: hypothetical protein R3A46_07955 [Thermomicrobiales bacterium]